MIGDRAARFSNVALPDRAEASNQGFSSSDSAAAQTTQATTGGLRCAEVFCPFTQPPLEPCCTTADDVAQGSARIAGACGVDFSATGSEFGVACWQTDQSGVVDDTCGDYTPAGGVTEVGCCTEEGRCGSFNTAQALGCHYSPTSGKGDDCGDEDIVRDVGCEATGVFGIRNEVDVSWGGRSGGLVGLTDDGRDTIVIHLMARIEHLGLDNGFTGTVVPCGVDLPAFYSTTLCESYKPVFPEAMWEAPQMPAFPITGAYQCLNPGCVMTIHSQTSLLGIDLMNPESPWPTSAETGTLECSRGLGADCFPDHDGDGAPGLTVELLTSGRAPPGTGCDGTYDYEGAPLSASPAAIIDGVRRAQAVLLGTRVKLGGSGRIAEDCNSGLGAGIADFVQSRGWGCIVQEDTLDWGGRPAGPNEPCTAPQAAFLDENLPIYNVLKLGESPDPNLDVVDDGVSDGPIFRMVRLGDVGASVSCADVRDAEYPR